jgi:glucosamine 6-phosphate synthetase-like amidotransferase/phosphosugar isomerase protein
MCSIFGSANFNVYSKLYEKGRERGTFAYGGLFLSHTYDACIKKEGVIELSKNMTINNSDIQMKPSDFYFYLGHTQAPTSAKRVFDENTSHPFYCGEWVVAHNGVLTNDAKLKALVKDNSKYNEVDSSVIPALIEKYSEQFPGNEVEIICTALSKLEGTFGLWIYCKTSHNIYIARSGSTLYANLLTNEFSSLPGNNLEPLEEGVLYLLTPEGLTSVGGFIKNSPFFII